MKYVIAFLLIPTFASARELAPSCQDLAKYLSEAEKKFQASTIGEIEGKSCNELTAADFYKSEAAPTTDIIADNSIRCANLGAIQARLEKLKLQQSVLDGFKKLKAQIARSKEDVQKNLRNTAIAKRNGKTFVQRLGTAHALELLLDSKDNRQEKASFIKHLKDLQGVDLKNPVAFKKAIDDTCRAKHQAAPICSFKDFDKKPEIVDDLASFIASVENNELNDNKIREWKNALAIRKKNVEGKDGEYSFTKMQEEFSASLGKLDTRHDLLTKDDYKKIASLPDFQDSPGDRRISNIVESILTAGVQKDVRLASNKFILHMEDAKARQAFDIQSKVSASFENLKEKVFNNSIPDAVKNSCPEALSNLEKAVKCMDDLKNLQGFSTRSEFVNFKERLEPAIRAGFDYYSKLTGDIEKCGAALKNGDDDTVMAEACVTALTIDEVDLQSQIQQLNRVADAIGNKNADDLKLRNYALHRWNKECGQQDIAANVEFCEVPNSPLSKDNKFTVAHSLKVAILYAPVEKAEEEGKALCENWPEGKTKPVVCREGSAPDDTTPIVSDASGPTDAPDGGHTQAAIKDAWLGAAGNLLGTALNGLMRRPPPNFPNPYPYNPPVMPSVRPMGISDSILFNARTQGGYGVYRPTPGFAPGTAFAYTPVGGGMFGR